MKEKVLYSESQWMNQWWLLVLMVLLNALAIYSTISQLIMGHPVGNRPGPDWLIVVVQVSMIVLTIFVFSVRLQVLIGAGFLAYRLFPFHIKIRRIPFDEIVSMTLRQYKPISEYGGWGLRYSMKRGMGMAYTVKGRHGLQVETKSGKKFLLGISNPEALTRVIEAENLPIGISENLLEK